MTGSEPASTLPQLLAEVVAAHGQSPAVMTAEETLTYEQLDQRTATLARALLANGAGKGTRLGLLLPDGIPQLTAFLAGLRIGAFITPISTLATANELAYILRNSDVQILLAARRFLRHDYAETLTKALPGLSDGRAEHVGLVDAPYLRSVWLDDPTGLRWAGSVADLLQRAEAADAPGPTVLAAVEREVVPSDDAFVVYTSGSTAMPKAVVHGQWAVARQPLAHAKNANFDGSERLLSLYPAFWLGGISSTLQMISVGGTLVYAVSPDPEDVLDAIERFDVTHVKVWHMRTKFRTAAEKRGMNLDKVNGLGAPPRDELGVVPEHLRAMGLGMTESFAQHSDQGYRRLPEDKIGAAGRAVNGIERRVVDPETGKEVAAGEVGELQLRGGALMTGFYKRRRNEVFTADGFYPTKDLVRIDEDGYAYFVGRAGDMLKPNAANVSRLEVEGALERLPDVELALVAGLPDDEIGESVAAAVVPASGTTPTQEQLKLALREKLSSYKVPRDIVFISQEEVPRTATGKPKLFEIKDLIMSKLER